MEPKRKIGSLSEWVEALREAVSARFFAPPLAWLHTTRDRLRDIAGTNAALGLDFVRAGQWRDALFRFKITAHFAPDYPRIWYNIGACHYRLGNLPKAIAALEKAIAQDASHTETVFLLSALSPRSLPAQLLPTRMEVVMVRALFNSNAAAEYDMREARAGYQGGKMTHEALKPLLRTATPHVLDLGCGTGIAARPWRAAAASITGVDCTPAMLALAAKATHAERALFDQLIEGDLAAPLPALAPESTDVMLAVGLAPYLGELGGLMRNATLALAPGGVLLITADPYAATGYGVNAATGRFGHSREYLAKSAATHGLTLAKEVALALYAGEPPTPAYIFMKA